MENQIKIGDKVRATVTTKNGYYQNSYKGEVIGFTKDNRIKVSSYRGVKCHSIFNVKKLN